MWVSTMYYTVVLKQVSKNDKYLGIPNIYLKNNVKWENKKFHKMIEISIGFHKVTKILVKTYLSPI